MNDDCPEQDDFEEFDDNDADFDDRSDHEAGDDDRSMFADPGGRSALRASSPRNPRNLPCPNCKRPNLLTPADKARGYQCDRCADQAEGGF